MATKRSGRSLTTAERYQNGQKQLAVWLPGETKDRFDALRGRTGQTSADLILRMVEAIELELYRCARWGDVVAPLPSADASTEVARSTPRAVSLRFSR